MEEEIERVEGVARKLLDRYRDEATIGGDIQTALRRSMSRNGDTSDPGEKLF